MVEVKQLHEVPIRNTVVAVLLSLLAFLSAGFTTPDLNDFTSGAEKLGSGDYRGALVDFNKAIELNPEDPESFFYRGLAKAKSGDFQGSIVDYDKAIQLKPNNLDSYGSRGIAKARLGDLEGAIQDFDKAIEISPKDGNAYFNRGISMEMSGVMSDACVDWRKALDLGHAPWIVLENFKLKVSAPKMTVKSINDELMRSSGDLN